MVEDSAHDRRLVSGLSTVTIVGAIAFCVVQSSAGSEAPSQAFLDNRPKTWVNDNRIIWLDAIQRPDNDVFYLTRRFEFTAKPGTNQFTAQVHGDLPPINRFVRLTASGKVVNPKILTDSSIDASSSAAVAKALCKPGMSDREKALTIWYFLADKLYFWTCPADYLPGQPTYRCDPTIVLNAYGVSSCCLLGPMEVAYWQAAGLKARKMRNGPKGGKLFHSMAEVFYDGAWHLFDLTQLSYYLKLDDKTIASGQDLCDNPQLLMRMVNASGLDPTWVPGDYMAPKYGYMYEGGGTPLPGETCMGYQYPPEHKMDLTLAPGESFQRNWSNEGFYWQAWDFSEPYTAHIERERRRKGFPVHFGNGSMRYPFEATTKSFVLPVDSAYPITDLAVRGTFQRLSARDKISVEYSVDDGKTYQPLLVVDATGKRVAAEAEAPILRGMYHVLVRFNFQAASTEGCGVVSGEVRARFQNNPRILPGLVKGENKITYTSEAQEGRAAVTYVVTERERLPLSVQWPNLRVSGLDAVFLSNTANPTTIPIQITNTGDQCVTLSPTVTCTPKGWKLAFSENTLKIEPKHKAALMLTCAPPQSVSEQIVGAEIDLRPRGFGPARKRLLLCALNGAASVEAEAGERNGLAARANENASGGTYLVPEPGKSGSAIATYAVNVPREGDYYLAARLYEATHYPNGPSYRFVFDEKEQRDVGVIPEVEWPTKLDHYTCYWDWRLHVKPIHLTTGTHRLVVTGLSPTTHLDCFALATNQDLAALALMNHLYCPAGFDEALASVR